MLRPWIPKSRTKCSKIKPKIREDRRENQAAAACLLLFKILTDWTAKEDGEKMCEKRMLRTESTNELWRIETLRRLRQIKKKYGIFGLKKQKSFFCAPLSIFRYAIYKREGQFHPFQSHLYPKKKNDYNSNILFVGKKSCTKTEFLNEMKLDDYK